MKKRQMLPFATIVTLAWVGVGGHAWCSSLPVSGLGDALRDVVEEEVWRVGGPRPDRILDFYKQAVDSGQPEAVKAVWDVVSPLFSRRWLDPTPFAAYDETKTGRLERAWKEELALWRMSAAERQRAYAEVLRTGKSNDELGLSWNGAAYRALLEHLDCLLPDIEATMEREPRADYQKAETKVPRTDLLELAFARPGDWEANYLKLIREKLELQATMTFPNSEPGGNRLIREALLELVHSGDPKLVAQLKALWRSIRPPVEIEKAENQRIYSELSKRGQRDPEYPRNGLAARYLVRAIQALGDPLFQEKNTGRRELLKETMDRLIDAGWLKPTAQTR